MRSRLFELDLHQPRSVASLALFVEVAEAKVAASTSAGIAKRAGSGTAGMAARIIAIAAPCRRCDPGRVSSPHDRVVIDLRDFDPIGGPADEFDECLAVAEFGAHQQARTGSGLELRRPSILGQMSDEVAMTIFDAREKEFEARFRHDQELQFKITARRNRLLGLWAAQQLGLLGDTAEAYAERVVQAQLQPGGNKNVVDKLAADLGAKDPTFTTARIRFELDHFAEQAKRQLMQE